VPPYPLKPAVIEHLDQLLSARKGLAGAVASLGLRELPHAVPALEAALQALEEQQKQLDE